MSGEGSNSMKRHLKVLGSSALALMAIGAVMATAAVASPTWKFNGTELSGTEKIVGAATESSMTIPGMKTTCEHFLYGIEISNASGVGKGSVTEVPLYNCHTNVAVCTVEA